jgi:hypothetical protein
MGKLVSGGEGERQNVREGRRGKEARCMYVCMYTCVCMYVCVYVCMYVCRYVCVSVDSARARGAALDRHTYANTCVCVCMCVCVFM